MSISFENVRCRYRSVHLALLPTYYSAGAVLVASGSVTALQIMGSNPSQSKEITESLYDGYAGQRRKICKKIVAAAVIH